MGNLIIETINLTKKYGHQTAVNNVNLHIERGKIYGLLGRNGAGKTTIMKMILGLTSVTSGEIKLFNEKPSKSKDTYHRIGSIIETPGFYPNLTGTENLIVFTKLRGSTRKDCIQYALEAVGLPYNDKKNFSEYSLGMRQRLGIANAIIHEPDLLILDEPINGLDPIGITEVRKLLKKLSEENGTAILLSSHILSEIEQIADTVGIIHNGNLLEECSYKDLQNKSRRYINLKVSSTSNAVRILEQEFKITDYTTVDDTNIRIYDLNQNMEKINKTLIINDVDVISLHLCNDTLEDYFKKVTGGIGID